MAAESKITLPKIKRKVKKISYGIMLLIGIIMLGVAVFVCKPNMEGTASAEKSISLYSSLYDVLMGTGCGLLATSLGTMLIAMLLSDITESKENLDEWGIEGIYAERTSLKEGTLPKKQLDIAALGLSHFRSNIRESTIEARIKNGLEIRILIPNPHSDFIMEQQKQSGNQNLGAEITELIHWADRIIKRTQNATSGFLRYQVYDSLPVFYYCRADNVIDVGPYLPGKKNTGNITYRYQANDKGGIYYSEIFEMMWSGEAAIGLTENYGFWTPFDQKKAAETCLQYFSDGFGKEITSKVVGIVAIFKDNMRRTFYSCNKVPGQEKYKSHGIDLGAIGLLRKCNDGEKLGKVYVFCDYKHGIEYEYTNLRTKHVRVRKITHRKLGNNEPCQMVLSSACFYFETV